MEIKLAGSVEVAREINPEIAIEAEWGANYIEGSKLTLNHHGVNSDNPAPCIAEISCKDCFDDDTIVLSHIDLDSIGGVLNVQRDDLWVKNKKFWRAVAFVDVNGPHKLSTYKELTDKEEKQIYAWWAWSQDNRAPRCQNDTSIDVSEYIQECRVALDKILNGDVEMLEKGIAFKKAEQELNASSYVSSRGDVILRSADTFVNHLYTTPAGTICKVVVAYNTKYKSITISKADSDNDIDCCSIIQSEFGEEAGGHKGIAGSPRGVEYSFDDASKFYIRVQKELQ